MERWLDGKKELGRRSGQQFPRCMYPKHQWTHGHLCVSVCPTLEEANLGFQRLSDSAWPARVSYSTRVVGPTFPPCSKERGMFADLVSLLGKGQVRLKRKVKTG